MTQPKKIIIISNTAWSLWNFRLPLARMLKRAGHEILFVAPSDGYEQKISAEFPFISIRNLSRSGINPIKDTMLFFELLTLYRKVQPDLVLNFTIKPNIYSSLVCGFLHIQAVSTITGLGRTFMQKGILNRIVVFLYRYALKSNPRVVFQNEDNLRLFIDLHVVSQNTPLLVRGSGVNTDFFSSGVCHALPEKKDDRVHFLMISRIIADKGIREYVQSAKKVRSMYPSTHFVLVGDFDTNPSAISKDEVAEWVANGSIEYAGSTDDIRPFICSSDVVVLPSYGEGLPKSLIEAMAMGKPIITTDVPGCRDLVSSVQENGFLVEAKSEEKLTDAMIRFAELSKEARNTMGENSRKIVLEKFDEQIILGAYATLVSNLARQ